MSGRATFHECHRKPEIRLSRFVVIPPDTPGGRRLYPTLARTGECHGRTDRAFWGSVAAPAGEPGGAGATGVDAVGPPFGIATGGRVPPMRPASRSVAILIGRTREFPPAWTPDPGSIPGMATASVTPETRRNVKGFIRTFLSLAEGWSADPWAGDSRSRASRSASPAGTTDDGRPARGAVLKGSIVDPCVLVRSGRPPPSRPGTVPSQAGPGSPYRACRRSLRYAEPGQRDPTAVRG